MTTAAASRGALVRSLVDDTRRFALAAWKATGGPNVDGDRKTRGFPEGGLEAGPEEIASGALVRDLAVERQLVERADSLDGELVVGAGAARGEQDALDS